MPARGRKFPARSCSLLSFRDFAACLSHTFITTSPLFLIAHFCYSLTINISRNTLSVKGVRPTVVAANRSGSRRLSPSVVPPDVTVPHFSLSTLSHSHASLRRVTQSSQSLPSITFARVSHSRHAIVSTASIRHVRTRLSLAVHTCFHRTHHRQLITRTAAGRVVPAGLPCSPSGHTRTAYHASLQSRCPSNLACYGTSQTQSDHAVIPQCV